MQLTVHDWDRSARARQTAASLSGHEVQIWLATVPGDATDLTEIAGSLSLGERQRAARMQALEAQRQFIVGRGCLREVLAAALDAHPAALSFEMGARGKPALASTRCGGDLRFNLAHSGARVAIAITYGRDVGVDIERIEPHIDWPALAARVFAPRELSRLAALGEDQRRLAFYQGWTRKEAYCKATGEGLSDALCELEVNLAPGADAQLLALPAGPNKFRRWAIWELAVGPDFAGAVVAEQDSPPTVS